MISSGPPSGKELARAIQTPKTSEYTMILNAAIATGESSADADTVENYGVYDVAYARSNEAAVKS